MKDLRHPHVAVLLGTFKHRDRLNLLIFPAASCDLSDLMTSISNDLIQLSSSHELPFMSGTSCAPRSPQLDSRKEPSNFSQEKIEPDSLRDSIILQQPLKVKINALQSYFICLSQALQYLHESRIRHKDIKPENALIDDRGYILFTDFGISKKFDEDVSHATDSEIMRTARYQSPEKSEGRPRDDSDDVFMLGCVFLEMASLILGKDWQTCKRHFSKEVNRTGKNEMFCNNLDKLSGWIKNISGVEENAMNTLPKEHQQSLVESLKTITAMVSIEPGRRPRTDGLWRKFDFPGQRLCSDCHPRHEKVWKATQSQIQETEVAKRRRSIRTSPSISEEELVLPHRRLLSPGHVVAGNPAANRQSPPRAPHSSSAQPFLPRPPSHVPLRSTYPPRSSSPLAESRTKRQSPNIDHVVSRSQSSTSKSSLNTMLNPPGTPRPTSIPTPLPPVEDSQTIKLSDKPASPGALLQSSPSTRVEPNMGGNVADIKFLTTKPTFDNDSDNYAEATNVAQKPTNSSIRDFVIPPQPFEQLNRGVQKRATQSDTSAASEESDRTRVGGTLKEKVQKGSRPSAPSSSLSPKADMLAVSPLPQMSTDINPSPQFVESTEQVSHGEEQQVQAPLGLKPIEDGSDLNLESHSRVLVCRVQEQHIEVLPYWILGMPVPRTSTVRSC